MNKSAILSGLAAVILGAGCVSSSKFDSCERCHLTYNSPEEIPYCPKCMASYAYPKELLDDKEYKFNDVKIVIQDIRKIRYFGRLILGKNIDGFFDDTYTIMYVPYSKDKDSSRDYLPDFDTLGHELWHHPKLGNFFHTPKAIEKDHSNCHDEDD